MQDYKQQLKDEFVKFAAMIADKIIDAYTNASIPDDIKNAAGDTDILKLCISSSIQRWQSNMSNLADVFSKNMQNEEFINNIKDNFKGDKK